LLAIADNVSPAAKMIDFAAAAVVGVEAAGDAFPKGAQLRVLAGDGRPGISYPVTYVHMHSGSQAVIRGRDSRLYYFPLYRLCP
jgi:hypothetical protein